MTNGFKPKDQKKPGDLILSAEWNAAMDEIDRLGKTLQDITTKATSFQGPLTIEQALKVKGNVRIGTDNPTAKLEVKGNLKLELGEAVNEFSSDITLAGKSNQAVPTELAVKTYVDKQVQGLQESLTTKKLQVTESLKLGNGVEVAQFSNTIDPSRESPLVVVPTEQAIITYIKSTLTKVYLLPEIFNLGKGGLLEMQPIPAGSFLMGSPTSDNMSIDHERPQHQVSVKQFWMGQFPVTQQQWQAVAGYQQVNTSLNSTPSHFKGDNKLPVEQVSWHDAKEFCTALNVKFKSQLQNRKFRLPSEAEWEYACRAGTTTRYYYGEDQSILGNYAWYDVNSDSQTHPVGQKIPNNWKLYDMIGNVWEWCQDTWPSNYEDAPVDGSAWLSDNNNDNRLLRGGSLYHNSRTCRCASRPYYLSPVNGYNGHGFRVVCS
ncbi:MAG: formylglycine-generating enzyme family protein [Moorea sp. SIO4E2]|uniref:formylglycine-generating enzyme family protein n=1 Tax=Moorena sp. SIO4E2 TaxID=2607826 RepID=UPI0013B953C1|nr:formylglycine-generating enzyme family protein [Moorena sp. SIO4E2]NEQ10162.1 formylglycine-generating enzyme family protein [Moorena sp. SIO4E2]